MLSPTSLQRRLQARVWILKFIQTGTLPSGNPFTGSGLLKYLRSEGIGYRTQDVYADIRYFREVITRTGQYGDVDINDFIPPNKIIHGAEHRRQKFDYVVSAEYYDEAEKGMVRRFFTIRSDDALTKGSVLDTASDRFTASALYEGTEFAEWELEQVIEYRGIR